MKVVQERGTKGKVILMPATLITADPKFNIAIHPVSREVYKIGDSGREDGLIKLEPVSGMGKVRIEDKIQQYLFPYIMTMDDNDIFPIDYEWQKIFNVIEEGKVYNVDIKKVLGINYVAFKAESSRMYTIVIPEAQAVKLSKTQLEQLRSILRGVKHTITRLKR